MEPIIARKSFRTLEPVHGMIYFAKEADEEYGAIGLEGNRMGYFASRSAAMGPVGPAVVIATFYNFNPELVRRAIPVAWQKADPETVLGARLRAVDRALRRGLGDSVASPELTEAADLARRAAETAAARPQGRPLFAAHAALPWPDEPHLVLWHAQTLLREYRGDAHVASLLLYGIDPVEALVTHGASGEAAVDALKVTRAWPADAWDAAVDRLRSRGIVTTEGELALTDDGRQLRDAVEHRTDVASVDAYEPLGEDGCARLRELGRPLSKAVLALFDPDPNRYQR
jgi:hypothetical protein